MPRVLASEDRTGLGHHLLDERMADAGPHGCSAELAHQLGHRLRADQVVDDGPILGRRVIREPFEDRARDERRRQRSAHRLRAIVDEEHSIGVAVEREPDVCALVDDRGLQVTEVLRLDGIGRMVGEGAVELAEEDRRAEWQAFEDRGHDEPTDAVRRVRDDAKRRERRHVDERVDVRDELGEQITLLDAPGVSASSSRPAATVALIWRSPVSSPTGAAPARQSLIPWYSAGL